MQLFRPPAWIQATPFPALPTKALLQLLLPSQCLMSLLAPTASHRQSSDMLLTHPCLSPRCAVGKSLWPQELVRSSLTLPVKEGHLMTILVTLQVLKAAFVFSSPSSSQDLRPLCYDMSQRDPRGEMELTAEQGPGHKGP